ncbi:MAG: ParB N-terminal domain-containing protein [Candidatus Hodarchaeota archaeon]
MPSNPPESQNPEKPLIHFHIVLIPIKNLLGHEQIVQSQVDWLKNNIKKLGYFFRPILVVKNHNVVLDGHHRVVALEQLGYQKVPCIEIEYLENKDITLGTWYPIYTEDREINFPADLDKIGVKWEHLGEFTSGILDDPRYGFTLKTRHDQFLLCETQKEIFSKFLKYFNSSFFDYVKTLKYALQSVEQGQASYALLRSTITKEDVLETAKKKELYAPKTTRHILSFKYQDIKVPLEALE